MDSRHEAVRKSGCLFCAYCWLAGANTIQEVDDAFDWATGQGLVRKSDSYVNTGRAGIVPKLQQRFGRSGRQGDITWNKDHSHAYVRHNGKEVYNAAGLGYKV